MDMRQLQEYGSSSSSWTDEKHLKFLDSVEASFVRTMLHGNDSSNHLPLLRLDRYMPDSSESTRDLKSQRRKNLRPAAKTNGGVGSDKKPRRRLPSQPTDSSHDQVVPEFLNEMADCKGA
ncbi:hypothetical protein SAY87_001481 [Trapa incisa]|uniref:Uncharacterized protein n=1 Tax=Trapa incisa TaxID=236973 RepID=A0AAN7GD97_9MYRT|nr:hypothetical protein SAY87_001481 [Trapa incisa]